MFKVIYHDKDCSYRLRTSMEVYEELESKGYDKILHNNGIPVAIEVEGWCDIAVIGEEWTYDAFTVTCEE